MAATDYYRLQFQDTNNIQNFNMLEHIPTLSTKEENNRMSSLPDLEEVKKTVEELNGNKVAGPDGFSGLFFQKCRGHCW